MAEQIVSDLIMKFVGDDGPIDGETNTELSLRRTKMAMGFRPGTMFEIESFTFKTGLGSEDETELADKKNNQATESNANALTQLHQDLHGFAAANKLDPAMLKALKGMKGMKGLGFAKFRSGEPATYPVDIKPFEFTRGIDLSSPTLMQYCIKRKVFKSASLIKRKAAGGAASGEIFLRFDFKTVLVTNIEWDNDDPIKETVEFVCRAVTINYLPQLPDGTLGAEKQAFWTSSPGLHAEVLTA